MNELGLMTFSSAEIWLTLAHSSRCKRELPPGICNITKEKSTQLDPSGKQVIEIQALHPDCLIAAAAI